MPERVPARADPVGSKDAEAKGARVRRESVPCKGREQRAKELGIEEDPVTARQKMKGDLGRIFPLLKCVQEARPRERWIPMDSTEISCRRRPQRPCGDKRRCIYCQSKDVANLYFGRSREVTYAAILCAQKAAWVETDTLSRMIFKLMTVSMELGYDKHLSHY